MEKKKLIIERDFVNNFYNFFVNLKLVTMKMEFIDLGLPSGTMWAKTNIGAKSETDCGLYFQWGDTVGYKDKKEILRHNKWSTCPSNGGNEKEDADSIKAWNAKNVTNGVLNNDVDAAYVHTNGLAKMPTIEQFEELFANTEHYWVENYKRSGVNGYLFEGDDSKCIFIPASGFSWGNKIFGINDNCKLWASSRSKFCYYFAEAIDFSRNYLLLAKYGDVESMCIRGVKK